MIIFFWVNFFVIPFHLGKLKEGPTEESDSSSRAIGFLKLREEDQDQQKMLHFPETCTRNDELT